MLLPKSLVLIAVILLTSMSTADAASRKKQTVSYAVEGCFSEFPGAGESRSLGGHNSNVRCQDTCRDKVAYLLRRKAIDVFMEISILEANKWTTVNAPPDAEYGQPVMDQKAAVVDQVHIL